MDINRNNYEEFFILYSDRELSGDLRKEVEAFVLANPDLEQEFRMMQDTRLKPDLHIVFEDKAALLKKEEIVPAQDYESTFLLYIDEELDREARIEVERLLKENPVLQKEFDLLRKTKLPVESVVFKEKSLLYHREAPLVSYRRMLGWTAAAAVLIFALVRISRTPEHPIQAPVVKNQGPAKETPAKKNGTAPVTPGQSSPLHDGTQETVKAGIIQKDVSVDLQKTRADQTGATTQGYPEDKRAVVDGTIAYDSSAGGSLQKKVILPETISLSAVSLINEKPGQNAQDVAVGPQEINPYAKQVSIQEPLPGNEDGIKIMAFSAKKNTMRGIFRKVSRVIAKTTNADEESRRGILVGNVQVGLK